MGKSTISMAMFNSYVTNYQRVDDVSITGWWLPGGLNHGFYDFPYIGNRKKN